MAFTDPQNNIDQFDLEQGMHVVDLGAGIGAYSIAAAKKVGSDGRVFAVDVQKELLEKIRNSAVSEHVFNIEAVWGDIEKPNGTKLNEASIDAVLISNTLFQLEDKEAVVREAFRILKPNRRVLLVEWVDSAGGLGPTEEQIVSAEEMKKMFIKNDFIYEKDIYAGDNHYGVIFRKKAS